MKALNNLDKDACVNKINEKNKYLNIMAFGKTVPVHKKYR